MKKIIGRIVAIILAFIILFGAYEAYTLWRAKKIINEVQEEYDRALDETMEEYNDAVDRTVEEYNDILNEIGGSETEE